MRPLHVNSRIFIVRPPTPWTLARAHLPEICNHFLILLLQNTKIYYILFIRAKPKCPCTHVRLALALALYFTLLLMCLFFFFFFFAVSSFLRWTRAHRWWHSLNDEQHKENEENVAFWCCEIYLLHSIIIEEHSRLLLFTAIKYTLFTQKASALWN